MDNFAFYGSATVGTKGQIVIPAEAREELGFKEGDKVIIVKAPTGNGIMVLKSDVFKQTLDHMQSRLGTMSDSLKELEGQK